MSTNDVDRLIATWLHAEAPVREPDHLLTAVLSRTGRTRRRPGWLIPERWLPMSTIETQVVPSPRVPWRTLGALALLILALAVGMLLAGGVRPRPLPAPFGPAANGLIAFAETGDLFAVDPVTGATETLLGGPTIDREPRWSLDGTSIAFRRQEGGGDRLYVLRSDGSGLLAITPEPLQIASHEFAPDGRHILFSYLSSSGTGSSLAIRTVIALAATDGSGVRTLDVGMDARRPSFRPPDGREILFIGGQNGLFAVRPDGTGLRSIREPSKSPSGLQIMDARWAPDGARIAYFIWWPAEAFTARTRIVGADGEGDRRLDPTDDAAWDGGVAWSNDGTRLAVVQGMDPLGYADARAAIIPVDGSRPIVTSVSGVQLHGECCAAYEWAPDDSVILWTPTDRGGAYEPQLLVDPRTGAVRPARWLTTSPPAWQRVAP